MAENIDKFTTRFKHELNEKMKKKTKSMGIDKNAGIVIACEKWVDDISNKELLEEIKKLFNQSE